MRSQMAALIGDAEPAPPSPAARPRGAAAGSLGAASTPDAAAAAAVDRSYYESYARLGIHEDMLAGESSTHA